MSDSTGTTTAITGTTTIITTTEISTTTEQLSTTTKPTAATSPTYPANVSGLPEYVPGSIKLEPRENEFLDELFLERPYRWVYYGIDGFYLNLLDTDLSNDWLQDFVIQNPPKSQNVMFLAAFIKHFNIPREQFDEATERLRVIRENDPYYDVTHEAYELPNADIIYTFDNEIINHFYRYE